MNLDELKENIFSKLKVEFEKFQDSSLYLTVSERYQNLSPIAQKLVLIGIFTVTTYLVVSIPLDYYNNSNNHLAEFSGKRELVRELLKASKEAQEIPNIPVPPDVNSVKSRIQSRIEIAKLIPEQIKSVEVISDSSKLVPNKFNQGMVQVQLSQLNLGQIVDLAHQIMSISPSIKLQDLEMSAHSKDDRYYDVIMKVLVLEVPSFDSSSEDDPSPPARPSKNNNRGSGRR